MRKLIAVAVAAAGLASVASVTPASAQSSCYWTGYNWSCPQTYYAPAYDGRYGSPYGAYNYNGYGYGNGGASSYPGPRVSGH